MAETVLSAADTGTADGPGGGPGGFRVGILGGGTAGYLAALALRAKRPRVEVTLIESSAVPVIGVGEATTPLLPQLLHADLGLDVHRLWREVRPTLKLGIRFGWGEADFNYPFGALRLLEPAVYDGDTEAASLRSLLMSAGRLPVFSPAGADDGSPEPRFGTAVAYHLDNRRFVTYLRERAADAGVTPVDATIGDVLLSDDGTSVAGLAADDGRRFRADLWVDCTGFRSLLLGEALASPWEPFAGSLFTDRALLATAPAAELPPHTRADTWDAGWCWSIPTRDADGTGEASFHHGYVYSSAHLDDAGAQDEVARRLPGATPGRTVRFRAGRRRHFVRGNVAALGNAYGFVEPLESTSLHLLVRQIGLLVRLLPWRPEERDGRLALANRRVAGWWDYVRWFLALHFRFNRRRDTPFWQACRSRTDVSAWEELLAVYRRRGPLSADPSLPALFTPPDPLWGAAGIDLMLLAQGVPGARPAPPASRDEHEAWKGAAGSLVERALRPAEVYRRLDRDPELREALAGGFLAAGPAFP